MEYASEDRTKGWAVLSRIAQKGEELYLFRPRGLDPSRTYKVTLDNLEVHLKLTGFQLMQEGLSVRLAETATSELLLFEAV
jgi:hypothetical protein